LKLLPQRDRSPNVLLLGAFISAPQQEDNVPFVFSVVHPQSGPNVDLKLVDSVAYLSVVAEISSSNSRQPARDGSLQVLLTSLNPINSP